MRDYVYLLYNPMAGSKIFASKIDRFIKVFQGKGYDVRIKRTESTDDFKTFFIDRDLTSCKAIIVAGGDGSVNHVVNGMINEEIDIPLGVLPAGTANDFAMHMHIPANLSDAIKTVANMETQRVDVGKANNRYFINVCAGGLFTNVSQNIDIELKNTLGKLAYYISGVKQLPKFNRLRFRITLDDRVIDDYFFLFLLLNGSSAGGFKKLGKNASLTDGYMDFVGIKACPVNYMPVLLTKIIQGDHLEDKYIEFFQCKAVKIECVEGDVEFFESDLDGESGPMFPLEIKVLEQKIDVICGSDEK